MKLIKKTTIMATVILVAFAILAGMASAQESRTLTVGTATGQVGADVLIPITLGSGATGVGGVAFTLTYDPAVFDFKGLERAGTTGPVIDGSGNTGAPVTATTLFFQANDVKQNNVSVGRVLVAGASADPVTAGPLFNARFGIKVGVNAATYPIGLQRTIINNPAAGYATDTFIPVLVGTGAKTSGQYATIDFPVIPATFVAGSITVTAPTFSLGGKVTYGIGGPNAAGSTVILMRGGIWNDQTNVGANGLYNFTGKQAGNYRLSIQSLDPNFDNFVSTSDIVLSTANITNADAVLAAKPQPVRVTGTVSPANYVPGMMAQVVGAGGVVIGTYAVAADGTFTSPLLPPGTYQWRLVYGSLESGLIASGATATFDKGLLRTISGSIVLPTTGGAVTASSVKGKLTKTLQVLGSGNYTVTDLVAADDYIVSVAAVGLPLTYFDGKTDINEATRVNVQSANATGVNFNFVPPAQFIQGWIKDSGAGVNGITVYGFEVNSFALVSTRTATDGSGLYTLSVPKGTYEIFVIKANGKIFYFFNEDGTPTQNEANATLRTVPAGVTIGNTHIDITEDDKTLTGRVTLRTAQGDPVANALITVSTANQRALGLTGADGRYTVGGLRAGVTYAVEMKPLTGNYPIQTTSILVGTASTRDFIIDTGAVLTGVITEEGSSPTKNVSGAMIYLKDRATGALVGGRIFFSAANGAYSIRDIKSGEYILEVTHPDYRSSSVDIVIGADMTQNIALTKGAHFKGTVTGSSRALAGATVIVSRTGEPSIFTVTNSAGFYSVYGLESTQSDYTIIAQARGFVREAKPGQTPSVAGTTVNFDLEPPVTTFTVSGLVTTDATTGAEIKDAIVLVSSSSRNFFASTTTGADGRYQVANLLPASDYRILVILPGSLPTQTRTFTVAAANVTENFTVTLGKDIGGAVTGDVAIPAATKIYVFLYKGDVYQGFVTAGAGGSFFFKGLTDGTDYKVLAYAAGYAPRWFNGQATIGAANAISAGNTAVNIQLIKQ